MKYKLINRRTGEETLCDKVTIDGFDYYVSDEKPVKSTKPCYCYNSIKNIWDADIVFYQGVMPMYHYEGFKIIIATNNPTIDIPKVVDEVEMLAHKHFAKERFNWEQENPNGIKSPQSLIEHYNRTFTPIFRAGYNKSQETHPFSEDDMIEFGEFVSKYPDKNRNYKGEMLHAQSKYDGAERTIDLLQLWKEQRTKIVYYE